MVEVGHGLMRTLRDLGGFKEARTIAAETIDVEARIGNAARRRGNAFGVMYAMEPALGDPATAVRALRRDAAEEPDPHYRLAIYRIMALWQARTAGHRASAQVESDLADPTMDGRAGPAADATTAPIARWLAVAVGILLALAAFVIYMATQTDRVYDHFVWQAEALRDGLAEIRYPVFGTGGQPGNSFFQDVLPIGRIDGTERGLLPFPPLPALLLLPFVAIWGVLTDDQTIFTALGAIDVAICWWMLGRLAVRPPIRLATTLVFAFGSVFWYTAQLATTWYQAHILAVGLLMLAVGLAIGADREARDDDPGFDQPGPSGGDPWLSFPRRGARAIFAIDPRQFLVGLLFGLACTARLSIVVGAPFFMLVGSGGSWWRRSWSAGLGAALPVAALLVYNVVATGHLFNPAYDYLYQLEARGYPTLGYHPEWAVEDPRYIPQNLAIMLGALPVVLPATLPDSLLVNATPVCTEPGAVRGLFDVTCPLAVPRDIGMSLLLTTPALMLGAPAVRRWGRNRLVTGAVLAVVLISTVNLMHFSQGWVQFGYRFSNDMVPFALLLVALGFERLASGGMRLAMPLGMALVVASIAINAWGVAWGAMLGW